MPSRLRRSLSALGSAVLFAGGALVTPAGARAAAAPRPARVAAATPADRSAVSPDPAARRAALARAAARRTAAKQAAAKRAAAKRAAAKRAAERATAKQRTAAPRTLVWRDDFTGPAGTRLDPRFWTYETGGSGRGNGNLSYDTDRPENVSLDGAGHLAITARSDNVAGLTCWYGPCRYTSGRITTQNKVTATHGRVEARMKLPKGAGLWPAFWMLGANYPLVDHPRCGELDIMELVGQEPSTIWSSVHGPGYTRAGLTGRFDLPAGQTFADAFHTFALDWSAEELLFTVDGHVVYRMPRSAVGAHEWVFDRPFFLVLNLTVGGGWGGEPAPETVFPARMLIEHVAIYR